MNYFIPKIRGNLLAQMTLIVQVVVQNGPEQFSTVRRTPDTLNTHENAPVHPITATNDFEISI